jgi:hypothetical protein
MPRDWSEWSALHFSQSNPIGFGQWDVPALLCRIADTIDGLGVVGIQDIAFHAELDDDGADRPSMTVYYNRLDGGRRRRDAACACSRR